MSAPVMVNALAVVLAFAVISLFALHRMGKLRHLTFKADVAKAFSLLLEMSGEDEPKQLPSGTDAEDVE